MAALKTELCPLLTEEVLVNLRRCGVNSVVQLLDRDPTPLAKACGLPLWQVKKIQHTLIARFGPHPVLGRTLLNEASQQSLWIFPFGDSSVDALLKGGVYTSELTELWGAAATAKTHLCSSLCCQVVCGSPFSTCYVEGVAGAFNATRLYHALQMHTGCEEEEGLSAMMEKVRVFQVFSVFELLSLLHSIQYHIVNETNCFYGNLRLLIIDPITLYLAPLLTPRLGQGHAVMLQVVKALTSLCQKHSIAVVYCNNVVAAGGGGIKPALGQTWHSVPTTRLQLSLPPHANANLRQMTVSKSPRQVVGSGASFLL